LSRTSLELDGTEICLIEDVSIPTSYVIADVEDPSKIDANHTKTVELPSTKELDEVFEFAFNPNVALQVFNPNLKTPVKFKNNGLTVLDGNLKLNKVRTKGSGEVFYQCEIKGLLADLFYSIGESYLTDIDFSAYDHTLNSTNIVNSWTAFTPGTYYIYPLIDFGYPTSGANGSNEDYYVHHLRPAIHVYDYLLNIFTAAGKTFTSTFLTSAFFKSLIIPGCTPLVLNSTQSGQRQMRAGVVSAGSNQVNLSYAAPYWSAALDTFTVAFPNDSTAPNNDTGGMWNTTTNILTVGTTNTYNINASVEFVIDLTHSGAGVNFNGTYTYELILEQEIAAVWTQVATSGSINDANVNLEITTVLSLSYSAAMTSGDKFRVRFNSEVVDLIITDSGGSPVSTGTANYRVKPQPKGAPYYTGTFITAALDSDLIQEGDSVEMSQVVPQNIKQKDFLKSIINMFQLYVLEDKTNRNNYLIEPRISFFSSTVRDWTSRIDITNDIEQEMIDFAKYYAYSYKPDSDYFNKQYQDAWQETYGYKRYECETEFNNAENKTEIIFSATPLVGNLVNGLRVPAIYKNENSTISTTKFNIRILQWGGLIPIQGGGVWNLKEVAGDNFKTTYPYAGHLDNPYAPTIDLCFDNPHEVYYQEYPYVIYTDNNLGSVYHDPYLDQLSHKDSRMIKCYVKLDELDIQAFDFRERVFIDGVACVVNAIRNFDILEKKTTLVEFLKLSS
jgi:hypothetical protein